MKRQLLCLFCCVLTLGHSSATFAGGGRDTDSTERPRGDTTGDGDAEADPARGDSEWSGDGDEPPPRSRQAKFQRSLLLPIRRTVAFRPLLNFKQTAWSPTGSRTSFFCGGCFGFGLVGQL